MRAVPSRIKLDASIVDEEVPMLQSPGVRKSSDAPPSEINNTLASTLRWIAALWPILTHRRTGVHSVLVVGVMLFPLLLGCCIPLVVAFIDVFIDVDTDALWTADFANTRGPAVSHEFSPPEACPYDSLLDEHPDDYQPPATATLSCFSSRPAPLPWQYLYIDSGALTSDVEVEWYRDGLDGARMTSDEPPSPEELTGTMEITDKDYLAWARAERAGVIRWWLVRGGGAFPQYQLRYRSASTAMLTVGIRILEKRRDGSSRVVREAEIELVPESLVDPMEWDAFSKAYQCDAVRPFYADRIDQMLARWSDPTFQISPTTIIDATDTSRCEHQSITHIGIVSDQVYSEKHKGASYGDWPITLQYFQSLARHLHLSDTEFLILGEDGPLLIQESLLPIFLNSGMQQQDLLVPNFHSLARFMRGTLMEEHVRCKGGCYGQRKPTIYWRGAGNHASNELLSAENYAAYPRFRPAFAAYAVHAARAASNGAVPASKDRIDLDIRSVITLDQSKPNIVAAAAAANAATPGCDSDSSDPPCPISTRLSPSSDADAFRYALSVDGYSSAWRVHQLMASPTVLVKTDSVHEEWWYHLLQPYEHYVPVRADFTDFRRQLEWMEQHPEELARISVNSRRLMSKLFRPATFYCYTGELLHRYSQTVSVSQHPQPRSRFQLVRTHFLCRAARKFSLYSGIFGAACLAYWIGMAAIMVLVASRRNMLFTQRYLQ